MPFITAEMWIHIHNLPMSLRSSHNISEIGNSFFKFLNYDRAGLEMGKWRRYIRVFAEVRIDEPLQVIGLLPMAGSIPLEFKYEKVTDYCLYCGKLGHSESRCISREEEMHAGGTGDLPEIYEYSIRAGTAPRDLSSFIRLGTNQWLDSPGGSSQSRLTPTNSPTGGLGEMVIGSSAR
ncbi:hypothetical protein LINPERHAP1_LOCUS353 [Linum perenne]